MLRYHHLKASPLHRIDALDGLRIFAATVVVAFHCRVPGFNGGFFGVDIFFVLSGYLITGLLLADVARTGTVALGVFYARRAIRLMPALGLMLTGVALAAPLSFPEVSIVSEVILPSLYISNISRVLAELPTITSHTWSLATEMQFYLAWPLVIVCLSRLTARRMLLILVAAFVAVAIWRWMQWFGGDWKRIYFAPDTHISGLVLGSIVRIMRWRPAPATQRLAVLSALVVLLPMIVFIRWGDVAALVLSSTCVELASAALILGLHSSIPQGRIAEMLASKPIVQLGVWSYGIYLWHYPIALATRETLEPWLAFAITLPLSIALAALSWYLVERPFSRWVIGRASLDRPRTTVSMSPSPLFARPGSHRGVGGGSTLVLTSRTRRWVFPPTRRVEQDDGQTRVTRL